MDIFKHADTVLVFQRIAGIMYLIAGIVKPFLVPENVPHDLSQAAFANQATFLAGVSQCGWQIIPGGS